MSRETSPIFVNSQDLDDDVIEIESSDDDDIVALDTPPPKPRAGKERQNKGKRKMIITVDSDDDDTGGGGGGGGGAAGAGAAVPKTQSLRDVLNIFPDADHVHIHAVRIIRHPLFYKVPGQCGLLLVCECARRHLRAHCLPSDTTTDYTIGSIVLYTASQPGQHDCVARRNDT